MLAVVLTARRKAGRFDLEAVETAVRSSMCDAGAAALSQLLQFDPPDLDQRTIPCGCGHSAHYMGLRIKPLLTAVGWVQLRRPYFWCPNCQSGQCPVDVALDVARTEFSPGVRRMLAVAGDEAPFDRGRQLIALLAALEVTTKAVERTAEAIGEDIAREQQEEIRRAKQLDLPVVLGQPISILYVQIDGTGVPVVKAETEGRMSKVPGQPAHTRECKLGCVFTQTTVDSQGRPVRDEDSTTYVAAIETAEEFGLRIYTEAWSRGWGRAETKVVMGDGANWIWNIADQHFPGAIQIVDLYHARQHLW